MKPIFIFPTFIFLFISLAFSDDLPSWRNTESKEKILQFVSAVQDENSSQYVKVEDRIAVFDNDGTLWSEQPVYFQFFYIIDYIRENYEVHPEWATDKRLKNIYEKGVKGLEDLDEHDILHLVSITHAYQDIESFSQSIKQWIEKAKHPEKNKLYTEMVFQPMLELINYLHDNDFKVWIVSGGGLDFMRAWAPQTYNIPTENIIGSTLKSEYKILDNKPIIFKLPEIEFLDDKEGKPIAIQKYIGKKPILGVGNSDGDYAMLEWISQNENNLAILIHHTDEQREYAYDKHSPIGRLDKGLNVNQPNWLIIDMKKDWDKIYP